MRRAALRLHRERIAEAQDDLLQSMAARWAEAAQMRRFLAELRRRLPPESGSATMTAWLEWAEAHVTALDPLSVQGLADLLRNAEALAPDPVDDEPWDGDEQYWRDMGWLDDLLDEDRPACSTEEE